MLFRLCNNGKAILLTREFKILKDKLAIGLTENDDQYTAIIKTGDKTFYRTFTEGVAELESSFIGPGVMTITIVRNNEIKPTWICDELYASKNGDVVAVGGNTLQYDKLLTELRAENDDFREKFAVLEKRVGELEHHYEEIYAGYENL